MTHSYTNIYSYQTDTGLHGCIIKHSDKMTHSYTNIYSDQTDTGLHGCIITHSDKMTHSYTNIKHSDQMTQRLTQADTGAE